MSVFWTPPWRKLFRTKAIPIIVVQNYKFLELGGEPVYLLHRRQAGDLYEDEVTSFDLDPVAGMYYFVLWQPSENEEKFPDPRSVKIWVNEQPWNAAYAPDIFKPNAQEFSLWIRKNAVDQNTQAELPDEVRVYFNPLFTGVGTVRYSFTTICKCIDLSSMQPTRANCPLCQLSTFGWEQYLNPNRHIRDQMMPHTFLLAWPATDTNLVLDNQGFVRESKVTHWTSPPPFSPYVFEHDVIVRMNDIRYEVINKADRRFPDILVQQEFDVVEVEKDHPVYNVPVTRN